MQSHQVLRFLEKHSSISLAAPLCRPSCCRSSLVLTTPPSRTNILSYCRQSKGKVFTQPHNMSFSNTDTGSKPADPYKETNYSQADLKTKIEDLITFIETNKFGMMTTRIASSGLLTSRCMALAAKVCSYTVRAS